MKYLKLVFLPLLILATFYILFFQSHLLGISLSEKYSFPFGTIVSWTLLFLFSFFIYTIMPLKRENVFDRILKGILLFNLILGAGWGILSFVLAGNWNFVFEDLTNFYVWIGLTFMVFFVPVLVSAVLGISKVFSKKNRT